MVGGMEGRMNGALRMVDVPTAARPGFLLMQTPQPLARLVRCRVPRRAPRLVRRRHVDLGRVASAACRRG
ncbi:putative leader peptide [Streptomyces sp. NPDC057743]|uniref:putative leader peptide n=1 Tax=Streptomyces sp. NPDC057743 TaxID=3346236 RepID=UPI0036C71481